jgi:hypothetical protein
MGCCWTNVNVTADQYILAAAANPANCRITISVIFAELTGMMICCTWNKNAALPKVIVKYHKCTTKFIPC